MNTVCIFVDSRINHWRIQHGNIRKPNDISITRYHTTKHVQKHSTQEVVGELDGLLAFAADGVGLVEDGGDAFLFGQGWDWNNIFLQKLKVPAITSRLNIQ